MVVCQHAILNEPLELSAASFLSMVPASTTICIQIAGEFLRRGSCSASTGPAPRKGAGALTTPPAPSGPEKRIINEPSLWGSAFRSGMTVGPQTGWQIRPCYNVRRAGYGPFPSKFSARSDSNSLPPSWAENSLRILGAALYISA